MAAHSRSRHPTSNQALGHRAKCHKSAPLSRRFRDNPPMRSPSQKQHGSLAPVLAGIVLLASAPATAQTKPQPPQTETPSIPSVVVEFVKSTGHEPEAAQFYARAKEALWTVYPHDEALKRDLLAYVQSGPDGPGLGFAGLALIPFHDPATVKPLLDRALDKHTSPPTRWCFLNWRRTF